jgi:hypothetical protein
MTRHAFDELGFELPAGYTFVGIVKPRGDDKDDGFAPNVVVTKDRLRQGETFQTYIDRQIVDLARKLKRFVLRGRRSVTIGGAEALELNCSWQGNRGVIEQRLTVMEREAHVLTFTASAAKNDAEKAFGSFGELLASVRFDQL